MPAEGRERSPSLDRRVTHMRRVRIRGVLRAVNANGYFAGGGAQLLIQPTIGAYPHVVLGDAHLRMIKLGQIAFHHQIGTNRGQEPTARRLVNAKQQPHKGNHIVLHEGLIQQGVQHGGTEHGSCGKGQTEHIGDMRPALLLALQLSERQINQMSTERGAWGQRATDLLHFAQMEGILVVGPELHESHVGALRQLGYALDAGKESTKTQNGVQAF